MTMAIRVGATAAAGRLRLVLRERAELLLLLLLDPESPNQDLKLALD